MSPPKPGVHQDEANGTSLHPTAQRLVDSALEMINTVGVQGVHVTELLEITGISVGSFYHHFANREDFLRVTLEHRFIQTLQRGIAQFAEQISAVTSTEELFVVVAQRQMLMFSDPELRVERRRRIEILGYALSSDKAKADVEIIQDNALSALRSLLFSMQDRGLIRQTADINHFAAWFSGMQLGRIIADILPSNETQGAAWTECSIRATWELLSPEDCQMNLYQVLPSIGTPDPTGDFIDRHPGTQWPERWVPLHRLHPTARMLIEATMHALDRVGEDGFRLEQILHETGISVGSLYHHFHDREGLIIAADTQRFISTAPSSIDTWIFAAERAKTTNEFLDLVRSYIRSTAEAADGELFRRRQLQVLASAFSRPDLLENIVRAQRYVVTYITGIFDRAKARGLIRDNLESEAYVIWLLGTQFGKTFCEMIPSYDNPEGWIAIAQQAACAPLLPVTTF